MKIRILSVLLLVNFFVLLTPRDWWHHCDHHEEFQFSHSDTHFDDGSCHFCDFDLGFFTIHKVPFYRALKVNYPQFQTASTAKNEKEEIQAFLLRGPPNSL